MLVLHALLIFCGLISGSTAHGIRDFIRQCNPFLRIKCHSMNCPQVYSPVCGSDKVTYNNECYISVANCLKGDLGEPIMKVFDGKCGDMKCQEFQYCIEIYAPVCGSDNRTYSNTCYLSRANCMRPFNSPPIVQAYEGECQKTSECDIACTKDYRPVCGSDGRTYSNPCVLSVANCRVTESGTGTPITKAYDGKCQCNDMCIQVYDPVCGSDGKTYGNSCMLGAANCRSLSEGGPGIAEAFKGDCNFSKQ